MRSREGSQKVRYVVQKRVKRPLWELVHRLTGVRLQRATRYFDTALIGAWFDADAAAAARRLPAELQIVERSAGVTELGVFCLEHREVDVLDPYREVGITLPVRYLGRSGQFFLHLPVTTDEARWGGVVNYGYPKFVADVRFEDVDHLRTCVLAADGQEILRLTVHVSATSPDSWVDRNFTVLDGRLLESTFDFRTAEAGGSDEPAGATLELGPHPLAADLANLRPSESSRRHRFVTDAACVLSKAVELGAATEREEPAPAWVPPPAPAPRLHRV